MQENKEKSKAKAALSNKKECSCSMSSKGSYAQGFWEMKSSYRYCLEDMFSKMFSLPGQRKIFVPLIFPIKMIGRSWYANFSSLRSHDNTIPMRVVKTFEVRRCPCNSRRQVECGFGEYTCKHQTQWVFLPSPSSRERAQWVPLSLLFVCKSKLTKFLAELTGFAQKLTEFSLPKQYSRNSTLPKQPNRKTYTHFFCCLNYLPNVSELVLRWCTLACHAKLVAPLPNLFWN